MSWVQDNWNDYYKDKQWIDTKGWCDLDGNPIPFEHDDAPKRGFSKQKTSSYENSRMYAYKVSFFETLLKYIFKFATLFIIKFSISSILVHTGNFPMSFTVELIYEILNICILLHFFYFIIRCAIEHNLRL